MLLYSIEFTSFHVGGRGSDRRFFKTRKKAL
jgi:hypothetical protein